MVKLRLRRKGRTHYPIYDIIAVDSRKKRDGAYLERLGYFDPHGKPSTVNIDAARAIYWLNVGAQPSEVVRQLLSYEGVLLQRHMQFKGKTEEEIAQAIEQHKQVTKARYERRKALRVKREEAKAKAAAAAQAEKTEEA